MTKYLITPPHFCKKPDRDGIFRYCGQFSRPGLLSLLGLALWLGLAQGAWAQTPTLIYAPDTSSNRRAITEDSPFTQFNPATGRVRVLNAATRQPVTTTFIPQTIINIYGTFTLADDGSWTYFLDNAAPATDALITGDTRRFSFSAQATTISTAGRVTITVIGADDPTTITGDFTRAVTETAVPITPQNAVPNTVMGRLIITDPDRDADTAIVTGDTAGTYGTFSIAADGSWTYILNNRMTATNRLRAGQRVTDPFTVQIADGTTATITINITGANDRPTSRPGDARTVAINERVMLTGMGRDPDAGDRITSYRWMQTGGPDVPLTGANTATVAFTAPQVLENTDLTFALTVADLAGVMHTNTVVITVHGPIGGDLAATVIEITTRVSTDLGGFIGAVGQLTPMESIFVPQIPFLGTYGTFSLTREGRWAYEAHHTIIGLGAGEERIERFPVQADGGQQGIVTITVVGRNTVPVILGDMEGFVIEDSVSTDTGTLEVRDLDNNQNTFQEETTPGRYGSFRITMGGVWTYTLDNTNPDVQNLQGSGRLTERFTVRSFDGTTATVTISISGIIEAGSLRLGGTLTGIVRAGSETLAIATGRLQVVNSDATNVVFVGETITTRVYGTFTVSDAGFWTYTLDNNDPDTMGLAPGRAVLEPLIQVEARQLQFQGFSLREDVRICVLGPNRPPTANAGQDQFPIEGNTVMLDGTGSSDPDEKDMLAYAWTQSDGILTVNLANATTSTPTFTAPGVNTNTPLEFTLTVTDLDGATSTDTVTITVIPTPDVTVSDAALTVAENGGTDTYTMVLDTQPTDDVTITPVSNTPSAATVSAALTFTQANWNTPQPVTVTGVNDDRVNPDDRTVTVMHTIVGGTYDTVAVPDVTVTVADDDTVGLFLNPVAVNVDEGMSGTYTVALRSQPVATVTVAITAGGDVTTNPTSLTFTASDWNTPQPVTVTAAEDDDGSDDTQALTHTATGGDYDGVTGTVTVMVMDSGVLGVSINPTTLTVAEGAMDTYTVRLDTQPAGNVEITVGGTDGEVNITGSPLTFTPGNWNEMQTVTVNAPQDDDATTDIVTLTHGVTGYGDITSGPTVVVTVTDNDTPGLILTPGAVNVDEGMSGTYTVALRSQPVATVTVAITAGGDVTTNPASLTFTTINWNTPQPVTVTAAEDADGIDDTQALTHTATGGDYEGVTGTVTVTVTDDDPPGVRISTTTLRIDEGSQATYTVRLNTQPADTVTVVVGGESGDVSVTGSPVTLTFTTGNWNLEQTVTVNAAEDADAIADSPVTLTHAVTGYGTVNSGANVVVTVTENDTAGVTVTETDSGTTVAEPDGTDTYTVVLNTQPTADVTITPMSGDISVATVSAALIFTTDNWNTPQDVTVTVLDDDIDNPDTRTTTVTHTIIGGGYDGVNVADVMVTATDDDVVGVTVSESSDVTTVAENDGTDTYTVVLHTEPTADVTITPVSDDSAVATVSAALTFTPDNWNTPQSVTVTGVNDDIDNLNDARTTTVRHTITGGDYDDVPVADVMVTAIDDDGAGVNVSTTELTVDPESGGTATYTLVLNTQPTADVLIDPTSNAPTVATVSAALTFTPDNWNTPQPVTVTGINDDIDNPADRTTIVRHTVTGGGYDTVTVVTVTVTAIDDDMAGVTVTETDGNTTVTEPNGTDTYTLVLQTQPTADVTITPASNDRTIVTVSAALTFTAANWNTPQPVTVIVVNDDIDNPGNARTTTVRHTITGGGYDTVDVTTVDVTATATDDDTARVTVMETDGNTTVAEPNGTDTYTLVLHTEPLADVTITPASDDRTTATVSAALTFTPDNWNTPQPVTVTVVNDDIDNPGNARTTTVRHTITGGYNGVDVRDVLVTATDDDTAGVTISEETLTVDPEAGGTATYTVVLGSQPTADVTITPASNVPTAATVSAALTFTPDNWNTPQPVTVTGINDDIDNTDDARTAIVSHTAASTDTNYEASSMAGSNIASVTVTVNDNDSAPTGISLTLNPPSVDEDVGNASITVTATLTGGGTRTEETVVSLSTADGTATAGADYTAVASVNLTIPATRASATVTLTIPVMDDVIDEGAGETLRVTGTTVGLTVTAAELTITDNDNTPTGITLSLNPSSVGENVGTATITVTATLEGDTTRAEDTVVSLSTEGVTATAGVDYTAASATLTIPRGAGGADVTLTIPIMEDTVDEEDETLRVTGTTVGLTVTAAELTITDNDNTPTGVTLTLNPNSVGENVGTATITVTLEGNTTRAEDTVVSLSTEGVTATEGVDYTAASATLTIPRGAGGVDMTLTIPVIEDLIDEANETLRVTGTVVGLTVTAAELTITDNDSASLSLTSSAARVAEGGSVTVTVALNNAVQGGFTVEVSTSDLTATAGNNGDYTAVSSVLTFEGDVGELQTFVVSTRTDGIAEGDESFTVGLSNLADNATDVGITATATITITDNDSAFLSLTSSAARVAEGGSVTVTVALNNAVQGGFTVEVSTSDLTATAGNNGDYSAVSSVLTFDGTAGETKTFVVPATDDSIAEGDESFTVGLSNLADNATDVGIPSSVTITITDNDSAFLSLTSSADRVDEGGSVTVTVSLSNAVENGFTVEASTSDLTATAGNNGDYSAVSSVLTFDGTAGETKTFVVSATDDDIAEGDESFTVGLSNLADNATDVGIPSSVTITITDNDSAFLSLTSSATRVDEGGSVTVTVSLNNAVQGGFTVEVAMMEGSAVSADYTAVLSVLTFNGDAGELQIFVVSATDDDIAEGDESFTVGLSNLADNATDVGITATATITITDNDSASLSLTSSATRVAEGGSVTVTVSLNNAVQDGFTVQVSTSDLTATAGNNGDYSAVSSVLTFNGDTGELQTFVVSTRTDGIAEGDESFSVGLSSLENNATDVGITATATITITDNDSASLSLTSSATRVDEGGSVTVTVSLDNAVQGGFTVEASTSDLTATAGNNGDYTAVSSVLIFNGDAGESQTFVVSTRTDGIAEGDESFTVGLSNLADNATDVGITASATITITDNDSASLSLTSSATRVDEGGSVTVTVALNNAVQGGFTVEVATMEGSAVSADYTAVSSVLIFDGTAGETKTFVVSATDDDIAEGDESFTVGLSNLADNATDVGITATATITITDNDSASLSLTSSAARVDEGGSVTVTVALNSAVQGGFTVEVATMEDSAMSADYTTVSSVLTFNGDAGELQIFVVSATDDSIAEGDESFTFGVAVLGDTDVNVGGIPSSVTITITDNDSASLSLTSSADRVDEGGSVTVTVALNNAVENGFTVEVATMEDSAVRADYNAVSSVLTFNGDAVETKTFVVSATDDDIAEGDESFTVGLSNLADNATDVGIPSSVTITITDNDSASLSLTSSADRVDEGGSVTVTVELDNAVQDGFTVQVSTSDLTATAGNNGDYNAVSSVLTFNGDAGETKTFVVSTRTDGIAEGDESFTVGLSNLADNATDVGIPSSVTITITDNDSASLSLTSSTDRVDEGGSVTVTVSLDNTVQGGFTVEASTSDLTATAGNNGDYSAVSSVLTFEGDAGELQTFVVLTRTDGIAEGDESFSVGLSSLADNATDVGIPSSVTITITDNNSASLSLTSSATRVVEGGSVTVTVALNNAVQDGFTVEAATIEDSAVSADYSAVLSVLTFDGDAGETKTFVVSATDDDIAEGDESFTVGLSNLADNATDVGIPSSVTITITDNDAMPTGITLSLDPSSVGENVGTATISVTATLEGNTTRAEDTVVSLSTEDGTATAGVDYTAASATLTIPRGTAGADMTLTIPVIDDLIDEEDETLRVTGTVVGLTVTAAELTITDNDDTPTGIILSLDPSSVGENVGTATISVTATLEGDTTRAEDTVVSLITEGVTATEGADYTAVPATLTILANTAGADMTLTIPVIEDLIDEANETLRVTGTVVGLTVTAAELTITDNDDTPTGIILSLDPSNVSENVGTATITVTATLEGDTTRAEDTVVSLSTENGTATEGADYTAASATLTILANTAGADMTLTIPVTDDLINEADETLRVTGTTTVGTLTVAEATLTITDNDAAGVTVSESVLTFGENSGTDTYTVALNTQPTANAVITVVSNDTSVATVTPPSLTFTATNWNTAQTVTVTGVDDSIDNPSDRATTVRHTITGGGYDSVSIASVTVTAMDDEGTAESPNISIAAGTSPVTEGTDATFTLTATPAPAADVTVTVTVDDGTGEFIDGAPPMTVTILTATTTATLTVPTTDDITNEADGTITATVTTGSGYTVGDPATASVTINDDDALPTLPSIANQIWIINTPIDSLTLPEATSSTGTLIYALTGNLPDGLAYDIGTRILSGTPTASGVTMLTYAVTDDIGTTTINFTVTIRSPASEELVKPVLAAFGRTMATGVVDTIGERFSSSASGGGFRGSLGGGQMDISAPDPTETPLPPYTGCLTPLQ